MGVYLVTNITDTSSDPKTIYIDDIPNRTPVAILPGHTVDLEKYSTRNQILESLQLKVHYNEGRVTVDTLGTLARERLLVDAEISSLDLSASAPIPIQSEYPEDTAHVSGATGNFIMGVRQDADGYMAYDGNYSPFAIDELGRLKVRTGFEESLLTPDGYLRTSVTGIEFGDVEINVEAEVAEGSARVPGHMGSFILAVRNDAKTALTADQQYSPVQVDGVGNVRVASTQEGAWTVTANQGTSPWISQVTNLPTTVDVNYGSVGASTLRTAAQIGNATGAADFGAGTTSAQTLRVVLPTDQIVPVSQSGTWTVAQGTNPWITDFDASRLSPDGYLEVASKQYGPWTVTALQGTSPWDIDGTVAATQSGNWSIRVQDGYGTQISSTGSSLNTNITNSTLAVTQSGTWTVNQGTSPWITRASNFPTTVDTNYGVASSATLRTAAQIGNATGAAEFGSGLATTQTLRVVLPTDQTAIPTTQSGVWSTRTQDGAGNVINSTSNALNTFVTNSTLAVTQSGAWTVASTQSGAWTVGVSNLPTTVDTNYGSVGASTLRAAAQIGNASGAADFGAGTTSAQTLRVVLPTDQTAIPTSQSGSWTVTANQGTNPWVIDFAASRLDTDGYLRVALADVEFGDLEINVEAEYAEDSQHVSGDVGSFVMAVRRDADTSMVDIDGDYSPFQTDSIGRLKVRTGFEASLLSPDGYLEVASKQYGPWTVTALQGTSPWVVSGTVAATQSGNWSTRTQDGSGNAINSTSNALNTFVTNSTIAVTQSGAWTVGVSNLPTTVDTNYGTTSSATLRTAAQIGNATGVAAFGAGTTSAQTLRVVLPTDQTAIPAAQSGAWTVAATQSGNWSTRTQDGAGNVINSTSNALNTFVTNSTLAVTQSGTWTVTQGTNPWVVQSTNFPTTVNTSYGVVGASTLRVAAQVGNATGAAEFGAGNASAQTLRTVIATDQSALPATQSGNWSVRNLDAAGNSLTSQADNAATRRGLDTWSIKGTPQHFNGTVGTTPATITPTTTTTAIMIACPATNAAGVTLGISFDGGTTFTDIERRGSLTIEAEVASFQIRGSTAGVIYQILVTRR